MLFCQLCYLAKGHFHACSHNPPWINGLKKRWMHADVLLSKSAYWGPIKWDLYRFADIGNSIINNNNNSYYQVQQAAAQPRSPMTIKINSYINISLIWLNQAVKKTWIHIWFRCGSWCKARNKRIDWLRCWQYLNHWMNWT